MKIVSTSQCQWLEKTGFEEFWPTDINKVSLPASVTVSDNLLKQLGRSTVEVAISKTSCKSKVLTSGNLPAEYTWPEHIQRISIPPGVKISKQLLDQLFKDKATVQANMEEMEIKDEFCDQ